jgi:hypothetical protein
VEPPASVFLRIELLSIAFDAYHQAASNHAVDLLGHK